MSESQLCHHWWHPTGGRRYISPLTRGGEYVRCTLCGVEAERRWEIVPRGRPLNPPRPLWSRIRAAFHYAAWGEQP